MSCLKAAGHRPLRTGVWHLWFRSKYSPVFEWPNQNTKLNQVGNMKKIYVWRHSMFNRNQVELFAKNNIKKAYFYGQPTNSKRPAAELAMKGDLIKCWITVVGCKFRPYVSDFPLWKTFFCIVYLSLHNKWLLCVGLSTKIQLKYIKVCDHGVTKCEKVQEGVKTFCEAHRFPMYLLGFWLQLSVNLSLLTGGSYLTPLRQSFVRGQRSQRQC